MSSLAEYPPKRHRLALSCVECRQRKVRCDRKNPCDRCVSSKRGCHYRTTRPGTVTTEHSVNDCSPSSSIGNHQDFSDYSQTDIDSRPIDNEHAPSFRVPNSQVLAPVWPQDGKRLLSKEDGASGTPSVKSPSGTQDAIAGKQTIPTNFHRAVIKGCYFGRSHWMTTAQEVGPSTRGRLRTTNGAANAQRQQNDTLLRGSLSLI